MADSTTPGEQLGLNISTDVGDVANALAAFFKLADTIAGIANSPAMVAARQNAAVQAALDQITKDANAALKPGADLTPVENDLTR